ncbi:MAG: type II secretion system protein [Gemmatimonadales bacterium]
MTLLETVIAVVILSLAAVGLLELFEGSSRNVANAEAWVTAVAYAEEGMEAAKTGSPSLSQLQARRMADGFARQVRIAPAQVGLNDIVVTVTLPRGGQFVVHRLVSAR